MSGPMHATDQRAPMADVFIRVNGNIELRPPVAIAPLARHLRLHAECPAASRSFTHNEPSDDPLPYHEEIWELVLPRSATNGVQVFREIRP